MVWVVVEGLGLDVDLVLEGVLELENEGISSLLPSGGGDIGVGGGAAGNEEVGESGFEVFVGIEVSSSVSVEEESENSSSQESAMGVLVFFVVLEGGLVVEGELMERLLRVVDRSFAVVVMLAVDVVCCMYIQEFDSFQW